MERRPRCESPKGDPNGRASAPDVIISGIRFGVNTSGRCASPRPMSPSSAAAAAAAAPVGLVQSVGNCIGRCCKKTSTKQSSAAVQAHAIAAAAAAAAPAPANVNEMPEIPYMTPARAKELAMLRKQLTKTLMTIKTQQIKLEEPQSELEESQRELESHRGKLKAQQMALYDKINQLDRLTRESVEKSLQPNVANFAIPLCGLCRNRHMIRNCPLFKKQKQEIEEHLKTLEKQRTALEERRTALEEQRRSLEEERIELERSLNSSRENMDGGAKTKRRHSKSKRSKSKRSKSRSHRR